MKRLIATAVLTTLVAAPAFAQSYPGVPDEGFYLGTAIGQAKLKNDTLDWYSDIGANTDDKDTAFKLFAGYQFNPNFAVEASYVDFGDFTATGIINGEPARAKASADGFGFALVGRLPIDAGFSVFGKLGLIAWDGSYDEEYTTGLGNRVSYSLSADDIDPFYGIGAEYVVNQVMMRLEFERYDLSDSGEDFEIDLISASIGYRF
ncbi:MULTISPECIES: outer membrane beta-barrel protein [unclassified Halomonas]|uniref:porin family protein n=1 Tax=unclassified Halomonas TaxID=2609666 RepID=UPI000D99A08F|nr:MULTISPECIES: outer membrane beta-barrel protein [unclassified Halomonas]PWV72356.1 opacity protein-like surface antigen [Halomonas sp. A11-A]QJQ97861.1 outer membrane beta-barrel protein [Halomonas sp. PGE1]